MKIVMTLANIEIWQLDPAQITPFYNFSICTALVDAGYKVRYFTSHYIYDTKLGDSEKVKKEIIYFRGLNRKWLLRYPRLRRIMRGISYPLGHLQFLNAVKNNRPDIVHIQWSRVPRFDLWLIKRIQKLGIPVVHTVHDVVPLYARNGSLRSLSAIYERVDCLLVHTEANKIDFLKVYPSISPDRISVIPLIEYKEAEVPEDASKNLARKRLQIPQNASIIGFFGSIRYYKGLDVLVDAFLKLQQTHPNVHLLIGGKIDPLEADKIPRVDTLTQIPNLHLFEGYLPTSEIWSFFFAPDVFVLPYRHIYQSAALITAMGFGCPIIATSVGGLPETIDGNGWIVPPNEPDTLARIIAEALSDTDRLKTMAARSTWIVENRHSKRVVAQALDAIYRKLLV
jgi:glycosyltransferase involved in cell wall biosynthesis